MEKKIIILLVAILILLPLYTYAEFSLPPGMIKMIEYQNQLSHSITFLIAFLAGIISFTSPCGFALFPTYFAIAFKDKKKSMLMAVAFSLGMLVAFTIFGILAGILGNFLNQYKLLFATLSGYLLVLFGIMLLFNIGFSIFNFRLDNYSKKGIFGIALVGFLFGTAWTPCVGPILVGILVLAANSSSIFMGTLSMIFYGLGVIVPLLIISYLADKYNFSGKNFFFRKFFSFKVFNKHFEIHSYNMAGGLLLIFMGILIILYKGTFFFQTTMTEYLPWSMYAWGYMNEILLGSKFLTSPLGNLLGIVIAGIIGWIVFSHLSKTKKGDNK